MINKNYSGVVSLKDRYKAIMEVLGNNIKPLSAKSIAMGYVVPVPSTSDVLSTGTICNVLAEAGLINKVSIKYGKSIRIKYQLVRGSNES